ncbi:Skt5 protein [Maudiozyma humilis]|uniref:Skt5 protein n=1 Tax=Maudiozyma humilis TaxID=51915 RepID=A0AAV5S1K5_MAUHU|nr:Skt5 protein [Kazachstania humilis]
MHPYKKHLYGARNIDAAGPQGPVGLEAMAADAAEAQEERVSPEFESSEDFNELYQDLVRAPEQDGTHTRSLTVPVGSNNGSSLSVGTNEGTGTGTGTPTSRALRQQRTKSVDLSHMYMLNTSTDTQLTATNESVADMSHQMITRYLGTENNISLMPRLKTIEMYRENVKKSRDPRLLFEYAQYVLQTALTIDADAVESADSTTPTDVSQAELKRQFLKDAQHYLKKLSSKGYSDAQYLLGDAYSSGAFGRIENKESFVLFQAAAKHGHVESAFRTAHCYEEGLGTTRDSRKALNFLKFAASRNHPSAMFKLGLYSFNGRMGLPNDVNTKQNGIKWLSRAAARANELTCAAPYELARIYENGFLDLIIPDEKYAMELYIQAAALGHTPSATLLGQIYETGNSVIEQDVSLSVHYYTQAAVQGSDPVAMLGLCAWYLLGAEPAFARDEAEAFQWALKAATLGLPKAQFTLGYFYENGKGCEPNEELAWKWYEKAARNNDERALKKMNAKGVHDPDTSMTSTGKRSRRHRKSKSVTTLNLFSTVTTNNKLSVDETPRDSAEMENDNIILSNGPNTTAPLPNEDYIEVQQMDTPKFFNNPTYAVDSANNNSTNYALDAIPSNTLNRKTTVPTPIASAAKKSKDNKSTSSEKSQKKGKKKDKKNKKDCIIM